MTSKTIIIRAVAWAIRAVAWVIRAVAWAAPAAVAAAFGLIGSSGTAMAVAHAPSDAGLVAGAPYAPGKVLVGLEPTARGRLANSTMTTLGLDAAQYIAPGEQLLRLPPGLSVPAAIAHLRGVPGVAYAVPDYLAHIAGSPTQEWFPNDPGRSGRPHGWEGMQWNFLSRAGVDAPAAWAHLRDDRKAGGRGVVVAIVDTGVAYRNWHQFRRSPDFDRTRFVHPYDFVAHNRFPLDREGHGTFVAGTVAESTNNRVGLTGIAYGASIMPIRVMNRNGWGDAATISRGIRYAVHQGAQVINLSIEFSSGTTAATIPGIMSALRYAYEHRVVVVAAAGNGRSREVAYPARAPDVISVGATTRDRCLARYSDIGRGLDLVAPGGGRDSSATGERNCHPHRPLPAIYQMTFPNPDRPRQFGYPHGWYGTSMAAPEVAAVAALVISSGVVGRHPTPDQVLQRLESTAQTLDGSKPNPYYGYGLVDAGAATSRGSG